MMDYIYYIEDVFNSGDGDNIYVGGDSGAFWSFYGGDQKKKFRFLLPLQRQRRIISTTLMRKQETPSYHLVKH